MTRKLFEIIFCAFVVISAQIMEARSSIYSSENTALVFSQCLLLKMTESQVFTPEDGDFMAEMQSAMAEAMLNRKQTGFSVKVLVVAFLTSMSDVIIDEDVVRNTDKKSIYVSALEQCSLSSVGYVDREFIDETLRIMSSIEKYKMPKFDERFTISEFRETQVTNPQASKLFNSTIVQSSSVPNPNPAQFFNPNTEAILQALDNPYFSPISVLPKADVNIQEQPSTQIGIPSIPRGSTEPMPGYKFPQNSSPSAVSQFGSIETETREGLTVPQTKESKVVVIRPNSNQQVAQTGVLPKNPPVEPREGKYKSSNVERAPQHQEAILMTSPGSIPQTSERYFNPAYDPGLEILVLNILANSTAFKEAFNPNVQKETATKLVRTITQQSLDGYDMNIVNEALEAVSDEVANVHSKSPENYALALSNALVPILKQYNLPLSIHGPQIAQNFISNLNNARQQTLHTDNITKPAEDNPQFDEKLPDFDFQSPPLSPEYKAEEIFSEALAKHLSHSDTLKKFFCRNDDPTDRVQISFTVIKSALSEFGLPASILAASIASGGLSELSKEELCLRYAKVISEAVADHLDEEKIRTINPESISNKMASVLKKQQTPPVESHGSKSISGTTQSPTSIKNQQTTPTSSVPTNFSEYNHEVHQSPTASYDSSKNSAAEDTKNKTSYTKENVGTRLESNFTTSSSITVEPYGSTDHEFSSALSTEEAFPGYTENAGEWISDEDISQEELAEYSFDTFQYAFDAYNYEESGESDVPLEDFQYAVEAYNSEDSENAGSNVSHEETPTPSKTIMTSESEFTDESASKPAGNDNNQNAEAENNAKAATTRQSDLNGLKDSSDSTKSPVLQTDYETRQEFTTATDTTVKLRPVELQPSFQGPPYQVEESSTETLKPATEMVTDDFDYADSSLGTAGAVSEIARSAIDYIHSPNSDLPNLCFRLNEFAPIVNVPPLGSCQPSAAIDYLLHVILSITEMS